MEKKGCEHRIPNGVRDLQNILLAMSNHLAAVHPYIGSEGGGAKSNAAIDPTRGKNF